MHKHMLTACCCLAFGLGYLFSGFTQVLHAASPAIPIALVLTLGLTCRASWLAMEAEVDDARREFDEPDYDEALVRHR